MFETIVEKLFLFDAVILFIMLMLIIMSSLSWSLFTIHLYKLTRYKLFQTRLKKFWQAENLLFIQYTVSRQEQTKPIIRIFGPFSQLAIVGLKAKQAYKSSENDKALSISDYLASQLTMASHHYGKRTGVSVFASIASSAPFIGLLGTVWGIYLALKVFSQTPGQIHQLTPAISEALVVTGLGLAVAIPALLMYNGFVRTYRKQQSELNYFAQQWHNYLLTGIAPVGELP